MTDELDLDQQDAMPVPPTSGELLELVDELIIAVEGARTVPLSGNVMLDRERLLDMLYRLRDELPEEMRAARWMVREREAFVARTNEKAREMLERARQRSDELVSESYIVKEAVDEAAGKVKIPRGWKECEFNTDPAQKETGQFLYGGSVAVYIDRLRKSRGDHMGGGRPTHAHGVTISPHGRSDNYDKGSNKDAADAHVQHTADVSNESHIPPYATVIWLCKG